MKRTLQGDDMGYESNVDEFKNLFELQEFKLLTAIGLAWQGNSRLRCPVGNKYGGNLRQDIDYLLLKKEKAVIVGNNLEYAIYVNKGTGLYAEDGDGRKTPWVYFDAKTNAYYKTYGQKPQPYLFEGLTDTRRVIPKLIEDTMGELNG
jgi:hypothetical protein